YESDTDHQGLFSDGFHQRRLTVSVAGLPSRSTVTCRVEAFFRLSTKFVSVVRLVTGLPLMAVATTEGPRPALFLRAPPSPAPVCRAAVILPFSMTGSIRTCWASLTGSTCTSRMAFFQSTAPFAI